MQDFLLYTNDYYLDSNGTKKISSLNIRQMIKEKCLYYGSSYEGRKEGFRHLCGNCYKNPVILDDKGARAFLITRSLNAKDCVAINAGKLKEFHQVNEALTAIVFQNDVAVRLDINYRILRRQLRLLKQYRQKRNERDIIDANG